MKPLPPIAMSATETQSPPLPTDTGAALANTAAEADEADSVEVALSDEADVPARESLRRRCDAAAGPSNRTATYEKAMMNAHNAA